MSARHPWCASDVAFISFACDTFWTSPVSASWHMGTLVAGWIMVSITLAHFEYQTMLARTKPSPSQCWGRVRVVARLSSMAQSLQVGAEHSSFAKRWEGVQKWRFWRRETKRRSGFGMQNMVVRGSGLPLLVFCHLLILFLPRGVLVFAVPFYETWSLHGFVSSAMIAMTGKVIFDYARTFLTDPGRPGAVQASTPLGWCETCCAPKPERCHHCKICRRCVLKMDHHCPFVHNCVGLQNYQFYCYFLVDVILATSFSSVVLLPLMAQAVLFPFFGMPLAERIHVVVVFTASVLVAISVAQLLSFHLNLVVRNLTTLDYQARTEVLKWQASQGPDMKELDPEKMPPDVRKRYESLREYRRGVLQDFSEIFGSPPVFCQKAVENMLTKAFMNLPTKLD